MRQLNERRKHSAHRSAVVTAAAAAGLGLLSASSAPAQTITNFTAAAGAWVDPLNWDNGAPTNTSVAQVNNAGNAAVGTGDAAVADFLHLGLLPGNGGTVTISDGTLTLGEARVGGREVLPDTSPNGGGTGSIVQTGGAVSITAIAGTGVQSLYLGDGGLATGNTASGTYNISGGSLVSGIVDNDSIVVGTGAGSTGTFIQSGTSTVSTPGFLVVGRRGATGAYTMSGGTLNVALGAPFSGTTTATRALWVGDGEAAFDTATRGTFTQTGGTVTVGDAAVDNTQSLEIGRRSGTGVYDISGSSSLTVANGSVVVGGGGETTDPLSQRGNGTLRVSGTAAVTINDSTTDGTTGNNGSRGNLNVGFTNVAGATTTGLLDVDGGTVTLNDPNAIMAVGNGRGAVGTVDQSAGTVSILGASSNLSVGRNGSTATYNLSGGTLDATTITMESAVPPAPDPAPVKQFNVSGGTLNATTFTSGSGATTAVRSLNVSGGKVTIGTLTLGNSGSTTNVTGGTFDITTRLIASSNGIFRTTVPLTLAATVELGNATFQVDANELKLTGPFVQTVARTLTKTGPGTLTISGSMAGLTANSAFVNGSGGGTLNYNTAGSPTIGLNANSGTTNIGADQNIRAVGVGGGTLNVGAFNVNTSTALTLTDGTINGTTGVISAPNYDVQKGAVNAILAGAGPLAKTTAETVTLGRANTYGGGTTVSGGTLVAANPDALGTGTLAVADGATARAQLGLPAALNVPAPLAITATGTTGGTLDLTDNAIALRHADQAAAFAGHTTVNGLVRNAFNEFAWNQPGITSTKVQADVAAGIPAALGILLNNDGAGGALFYGNGTDLPLYEGRAVDANTVMVEQTLLGDGDLNGTVDSVDFALFQAGYTGAAPYIGFAFGDYDYNGVIDSVDFGLFQAGYEYSQSNPTPEMVAFAELHHLSLVAAAVPEPTTLGLLGAGALGLLRRRRRGE